MEGNSNTDGVEQARGTSDLNERLSRGSESIAWELDRQFRTRLCELVDRQMNEIYKRRQDPEDIVQSVLKSFYVRAAKGEFVFENRESLWNLLKQIARNKMLKRIDKDRALKRDIGKETLLVTESIAGQSVTQAQAHVLARALDLALKGVHSPTPEIFQLTLYGYSVAEVIDVVLRDLESPYPEILQLRLGGASEQEIANELGCLRGKVRYRLRRIQEKLAGLLADDWNKPAPRD